MNIPKRFERASLSDWAPDTVLKQMGAKFMRNINTYVDTGVAPVLIGKSGAGKSRAAAAILNDLRNYTNSDLSAEWFSGSDAFNTLADLRDCRSPAYFELLNQMQDTDLIVVDDMTALRDTPRLREYLWRVLNHRYEECKPTIITINSVLTSKTAVMDELATWSSPSVARRIRDCAGDLFTLV